MNRRLVVCAIAAITAAALVVTPTFAKGGVVARVLTPIPQDARAGTRVAVVWTLHTVEEGKRQPWFNAGPFIRLFGPGGSHSVRVFAMEPRPGRYRATVRIPRGGVRRVVIGLMGTSCDPTGCRPAPALFRVAGDPIR
jgi:hypothetical protein